MKEAVAIRSPQDAQNLGISTVYQEITLCPNLSVAENMYIRTWKRNRTELEEDECGRGQDSEITGYSRKGNTAAFQLLYR